MRWRRCSVAACDLWNRSCRMPDRAVCFLSLAHDCRTNISQLSMGHSAAGGWFLVDLSRAVAVVAETRSRTAAFPRGAVFAQAPSLQINGDVRRGEADERR